MIYEIKKRIEKTVHISDEFWNDIQSKSKIIHLKKNEILVRNGAKSKDVYYIISGCFVCLQITKNGDIQAIWFYLDDAFDFMVCNDSYHSNMSTKYE